MAAAETLRNEILGLQRAQAELTRWKLIAVGGTAGVAFGTAAAGDSSRLLILAIVPLITVYCDLLIRDYDIRIGLIATFLLREGSDYAAYEKFLCEPAVLRARPWIFGNAATLTSSIIICLFIIWVGVQPELIAGDKVTRSVPTLVVAGLAGIVATCVIHWQLMRAYRQIGAALHRNDTQ